MKFYCQTSPRQRFMHVADFVLPGNLLYDNAMLVKVVITMKKTFLNHRLIWLLPTLFSGHANAAMIMDAISAHGLSLGALLTMLAVLLIQVTHQRSLSSLIIAFAVLLAMLPLLLPLPELWRWGMWLAVLVVQSAGHYRLMAALPTRRPLIALATLIMLLCALSEWVMNTGMGWLAIPLLLSAVVCFVNGWDRYGKVVQALSDEKEHSERQMVEAGHDVKTGLPNRLKIEHIGDSIIRAGNVKSLSFLLIKMKNFDEINKVLGHGNGDLLLAQAAQRISRRLRGIDKVVALEIQNGHEVKVANLGGVDFGILIDSSDKVWLAQQIATDFGRQLLEPLMLHSCALEFVITPGIAVYPEHGGSIRALINHAHDAANTVAVGATGDELVYSPDAAQYTNERIALMAALRDAIDHNRLVLHVQPLINLKSHEVYGGEVFIRWHHPEKGLIHPQAFIELAEQTGVMFSLTQWILTQVVSELKRFAALGLTQTLAVNIANTDLLQMELLETIEVLVAREEVAFDRLTLEIKESALLDNPDKAAEVLQQVHQRGIRIAIDDFGTGYSSLNYLRKLPISEVKIDGSFIGGLDSCDANQAITGAIIDIARKLSLDVVAEGVEEQQSADKLLSMGCVKAQGYLYSKPFELAGFANWVKQWEKAHPRVRRE